MRGVESKRVVDRVVFDSDDNTIYLLSAVGSENLVPDPTKGALSEITGATPLLFCLRQCRLSIDKDENQRKIVIART